MEAALWGAGNARVTREAGFTTYREMGPTWPCVGFVMKGGAVVKDLLSPRR